MKKIIPFIASNFTKDKIWLKKNNPNQSNYNILLALDDSLSMSEKEVGSLALNCILVTFKALLMCGLECNIGKIRESLEIVGKKDGI